MIKDEELGGRLIGKSFSQLLCNPGASGMTRNVEVNNLSPVMANNKEAVQQLKGDRRDREKIHGSNSFAMIAKKGQPAPNTFSISGRSLHPTGYASLGYIEAEHEQFAADAGSPHRVPTENSIALKKREQHSRGNEFLGLRKHLSNRLVVNDPGFAERST